MLFNHTFIVDLFYHHTEHPCIGHAVNDLRRDLEAVSGKLAGVKPYLPREESGYIVVGSLENAAFRDWLAARDINTSAIEGQWEQFILRTLDDGGILVCGSDRRGAMWGIYHISEHILGVDPLYFWTDLRPTPLLELIVPPLDLTGGPKSYKFRGWFLNDEDLLTEWLSNGGKRYIDYPFYHQVTHHTVIERVIEAALRSRQNLIIPASFIDIMNPAEENLVRMATERGLFVSQHHVEPMGVSHFGWDNYWGKDVPASFVTQADKFEEIWTLYAEKWAQYETIIWQFGLRGRGDRPVWFNDDQVPPSMAERGALISQAYQTQADIVQRVTGSDDFYATTTLWMEGSELQSEGHLTFPDNTMIVFADHGASQMMLDDFYNTEREAATDYGGYFHVAFWGAGPRLVAGTSLAKLHYNYKIAVEKGDTAYSILNVGNLREFPLGVESVARMTWDFDRFDPDVYLKDWITRHFGAAAVGPVSAVYQAHFAAFYELDGTRMPGQRLLLDGVTRIEGLKFIEMIQSDGYKTGDRAWLGKWGSHYAGPEINTPEEYIAFYKIALAQGLDRWQSVQDLIHEALPSVEPARQQFFLDHFQVQLDTIVGLYRWAYHLCLAAEAEDRRPHLADAVYAMQKVLLDRRAAEHDHWVNWYRGDRKMNLPELVEKTKALLM
jgi:hypothetical protein